MKKKLTGSRTDALRDGDGSDPNLLWNFSGFLVRRLWQIHTAIFLEQTEGTRITPVQFSILLILQNKKALDQGSLASEIGIDRSNAADILNRMERSKLIKRNRGVHDRRAMIVSLTAKGNTLLEKLDARVLQSHARLVEALPRDQRPIFIQMLQCVVAAKNDLGRAPLKLR
jgi:DNA-binding MarR family transcriptional regulator